MSKIDLRPHPVDALATVVANNRDLYDARTCLNVLLTQLSLRFFFTYEQLAELTTWLLDEENDNRSIPSDLVHLDDKSGIENYITATTAFDTVAEFAAFKGLELDEADDLLHEESITARTRGK